MYIFINVDLAKNNSYVQGARSLPSSSHSKVASGSSDVNLTATLFIRLLYFLAVIITGQGVAI